MEGTLNGRPGVRELASTSSSGGHQRRNVEEETRQRSPSQGADVQYCKRQYDVVVTYIRYALRSWAPLNEAPLSYWTDGTVSPWTGSSAIQVTPELRRVLTRAKTLCEDCCMELPPLKAALRHAQRSEAFADVLTEIQWYKSVVHNGSIWKNLQDRWEPELKDFPWQAKLGRQEQQLLQIAEQEDWLEMMEELGRRNSSHLCSAEACGNVHAQGDPQYCLSTQMLARILPAQDLRVAHGYDSFLWSFDKQVLQHGPTLGSGAFGAVSEVTWLGCKYAQKVFNPAGLHSFQAERDALAKMNHPHIVKVFAHSEDSLLMDLMCMDLHKFMQMRRRKRPSRVEPFSLAATIDLMLQIADAVSHIHSRNLAHRDLKSSNILVNPLNMPGLDGDDDDDDDGFVFAKIADFGMAKVKREITRNSHLTHNVGTRKWMAPEIFGANLDDDPVEVAFLMKADVYSFGVICYEILSGEEPYSDVQRLSELYSKLTAPFPLRPRLPASCPTGLASLICACWDADPQKRPAFADVCRVLRYLKGLPTLMDLGEKWSIVAAWPYDMLKAKMKMEGPFGSHAVGYNTSFISLPGVEDYQGFMVEFSDCTKRELTTFEFASGPFRDFYAPDPERSTGWILFDKPSEFLVQIEGSFEQCDGSLVRAEMTTVTFITTTRRYGPFGTTCKGDERFRTNLGRIVGMAGLPGCGGSPLIFSVIPEIVQCLRHYLENDDPFV